MKKKKFNLSAIELSDFHLIAIHTQHEPYKVAYLLNKRLEMRFERRRRDLELMIDTQLVSFPVFEYYNQDWDTTSYLIGNRVSVEEQKTTSENLFEKEPITSTEYVLKTNKQVDYLLKIEDELSVFKPEDVIQKLITTPHISTAYSLETQTLKHPEHLILD
jgi:hypothetical protein